MNLDSLKESIITGQLVDIHTRKIFPVEIHLLNGKIREIKPIDTAPGIFILPGLIDAHVHVESSMVTPGAFAAAAVKHGTTAVVSDPHEIANVLGSSGVQFMIDDAEKVPVKFFFGAPSCVPATSFETSGAIIDSNEIMALLKNEKINFLSEMMNFPGVIYDDPEVVRKINIAKELGKPIDGHAPGLSGEQLKKYINSGISTDHECSNLDEALEKLNLGMKILIREGSAARNLNALKPLIKSHPGKIMLCSDDLHPEMLQHRHINKIISGLINDGFDLFDVIRSATINPALHYNLSAGLLRHGDPADLILVENLSEMNILETWIEGSKVYENGRVDFNYKTGPVLNNFNCSRIKSEDIVIRNLGGNMRVIEALDGELLTRQIVIPSSKKSLIESDPAGDVLKIVVKDRYTDKPPVTGLIKGFGLRTGAFGSSVAHDSHNIICVGVEDEAIVKCINRIIEMKGGLAVHSDEFEKSLELSIGGIMSNLPVTDVANMYQHLSVMVNKLGCSMKAPFMTLSFMALLVIPEIKIGDMGLFNVSKFQLVQLFT